MSVHTIAWSLNALPATPAIRTDCSSAERISTGAAVSEYFITLVGVTANSSLDVPTKNAGGSPISSVCQPELYRSVEFVCAAST